MVFSCVIVLALSSFVTATPHNYGVQTGAVAKAEANAVAGTFGVPIPLRIPSGSGFSGSFSKSSSSSFASSSSSASSSSYSYSGSNGIPGPGCVSGNCKSGEVNFPSTFNGSPNTQIMHHSSEASALAAAKASAESSTYFNSGSSAPCQQGNCKGLSESTKCSSGQCDRSSDVSSIGGSESGIQTINSENKPNCLSGNCFPMPKEHPDSSSNSDDYEVNFSRNPKIFNPTAYRMPNLQLNNGITSSTFSPPENNSPKCNSPSCDTFIALSPSDNAQSFNPQRPSTHLVTPNLRPTCTTHNCNTDSTITNENNGKPSSYNVPILGTNPSYYNAPYNPSMAPLSNIPSPTVFKPNCGSKGCMSNNGQANTGVVGSNFNYPAQPPHNGNFGKPYQSTTNIPLPCNTPNCGNFAVPNQPINPGWSNTNRPNFITPLNANVPTYNNMFGGTVGSTPIYPGVVNMVQPNNYANHNVPSYSEGFGGPKGAVNSAAYPGLTGTAKPNLVTISDNQNAPMYTKGFGGPPGPINQSVYPGSFKPAKPDIESTESNLPVYTGGFGGPSGSVTAAVPAGTFTTLKPNLNTNPHQQIHTSGFGGSTGALATASTIQHSTGYTPIHTTNTANTLSTNPSPTNFVQNNVANPSGQVNEKEKLPPYTGGFGGPSGILKPNEYDMPSKLPSPTQPAIPCSTFDCSKKPISNENYNKAQASATALANAEAVSYAGGFGAPPGLLQPEKNKNINSNSDIKGDNKNNQVNNEKTQSEYAGNQQNSGDKKTSETDFNDFLQQSNIKDTHPVGAQNNVAGNSPVTNKNIQSDTDKEKAFNDYIKQTNLAGAFANAGAQANVGGTFPSVKKNKYDGSDQNEMLNDFFAQANIADAVAGGGAQSNVADQDNFVALTGSNSNQNSGCNNNCRPNSYGGVVAGASASAKSISNAGSWGAGQSFAASGATAHAVAGASVKGGYGRR